MRNIVWVCGLALALAQTAAADWRDEVIYLVMVDRFADGDPTNNQTVDLANPLAFHGGDLIGLTERLDYIAELGATALWITPVAAQASPIEAEGRRFHGHHGYWAEDFAGLDPRYGSESDLAALVDAAHARGLKVLLDVVYNHVGQNSGWTRDRPDWLRQGSDCGGDAVTLCLAGLPDLRTEDPDLRRYLFDAQIGLAERTGVDGFRLDTYKHIATDFWAAHRAETRARLGADFFLLGEIWDADKITAQAPFEQDTLDAVFDFSFRNHTLKFLTGVENSDRFGRYLTNRHSIEAAGLLAPYLSSHDMPMLLAMLRGDTARLRIAFALLMFAEGPPVIAWGEEIGRRGGPWPDNREDMDWAGGDSALRDDLRSLIALRHARPDMRSGRVEVVVAEGDLVVLRRGGTALAVNRGESPLDLPLPGWAPLFGSLDAQGRIGPTAAVLLGQP